MKKPSDGYMDFKSKAGFKKWQGFMKKMKFKTSVKCRVKGKVMK